MLKFTGIFERLKPTNCNKCEHFIEIEGYFENSNVINICRATMQIIDEYSKSNCYLFEEKSPREVILEEIYLD